MLDMELTVLEAIDYAFEECDDYLADGEIVNVLTIVKQYDTLNNKFSDMFLKLIAGIIVERLKLESSEYILAADQVTMSNDEFEYDL